MDLTIQRYDEAIRRNSEDVVAYHNRGLRYCELGQFERGIQDLNKAILLIPDRAESYFNRGNAYHDLGQFERSIQDYNEAICLNPEYVDAYNNRGNAYHDMGQFEKSIQDYNEAIRLNPDDDYAYYNRGNSYIELGQFQSAIEDYDKAISLTLDGAWIIYYNRGLVYCQHLRQQEQGIKDFDEVIRINPMYAHAYFNRGLSYRLKYQKAEAITDFKKYISLTDNVTTYIDLPDEVVWIKEARDQITELSG